MFAKEPAKVQKEWQNGWQSTKQEIVQALQKVENMVDQHLSATESKIDNLEQNMKQIKGKVQVLSQTQD